MALKGHVSIELTDVHTKEVQKIEGDNMLTNAISKYCTLLSAGVLKKGISASSGNYEYLTPFPIAKQLLGGLLVFSDNLTENVNNMSLPDTGNEVLAMCDNTLSNEDERGSYNTSESQAQTNGFKHVWDFATNQCNGTINALSLTSLSGSVTYFCYDAYLDSAKRIKCLNYQLKQVLTPQPFDIGITCYKPIYYDLDTQELYLLGYKTNPHKLVIYKATVPFNSFTLNDTGAEEINTTNYEFETVTEHEIVYSLSSSLSNIHSIGNYLDKTNQTITTALNYNASRDELFYIVISMLDWSISEQTLTLPTIARGNNTSFGFIDGCVYYVKSHNDTTCTTTVVKCPISDTSNYVELTAQFDGAFYQSAGSIITSPVNGMGVMIYMGGQTSNYGYIFVDKETNAVDAKRMDGSLNARECLLNDLMFFSPQVLNIFLNPRYLGTIYNLPSPITKTASQTMKIIYTLTDANN